MTTDTKAVARYRAILSHGLIEVEAHPVGSLVTFTDHERVVGELSKAHEQNLSSWLDQRQEIETLRNALAASRAEVEAAIRAFDNAGAHFAHGHIGAAVWMRSALEAALPHLQGEEVPFGWVIRRPDMAPLFLPDRCAHMIDSFRTEDAIYLQTTVTPVYLHPQPAELAENGHDLEQFRKPVERWKLFSEFGVDVESMPMHFQKSPEKYAADVAEANRLLALIGPRDAAPGVGNG